MKRTSKIVLVGVSALLCLANAAQALTLVPGTYKMEWRIPGPEQPAVGSSVSMRFVSDAETVRFKGLRSTKALYGERDEFSVVVDESGGTGTGYDVAYVFPTSEPSRGDDLSKALRISLHKEKEREYAGDKDGNHLMDWVLGDETRRIANKVAIDVTNLWVYPGHSQTERWDAEVSFRLRGGWFGKLMSDAGPLDIDLHAGLDRLYSASSTPQDHRRSSIYIGKKSGTSEDSNNAAMTWRPSPLYGKLYVFKPSPAGDKLTVEHYDGPAGTLKIDLRDVGGEPTRVSLVSLISLTSPAFGYQLGPTGEAPLPAGDYTLQRVGFEVGSNRAHYLQIEPNNTLHIYQNKTTVVSLGGPLNIHIHFLRDTPPLHPGTSFTPYLSFSLGGYEMHWPHGVAYINLLDSAGNTLATTQASSDNIDYITIPKDCKPGNYTLEAVLDPKAWTNPPRATLTIKVVE